MKKLLLLASFTLATILFTSCESKEVKMGRAAVYEKMSELSGEIVGEKYYVANDDVIYWEIEYKFYSGHPGAQFTKIHFLTNGDYVRDITETQFKRWTISYK